MLKKLIGFALAICVFHAQPLSAQKYFVKDLAEISDHSVHYVYPTQSEDYLDIVFDVNKGKQANITINRYNNQLRKVATAQPAALSGKAVEFGVYFQRKNVVLASDEAKNIAAYQIDDAGKEVSLLNAGVLFAQPKSSDTYTSGCSPDSSMLFVLCNAYEDRKDEVSTLSGAVFNKDLTLSSKFSFNIPAGPRKILALNALLTNAGRLAVLYATENDSKDQPLKYTLLLVEKTGKVKPAVDLALPAKKCTSPAFAVNGEQLTYAGISANGRKDNYTNSYTTAYDLTQAKQMPVAEQSFLSAPYLAGTKNLDEIAKKGIGDNAALKKTIVFSDGSTMALLEVSSDRDYQSYHGNDITNHSYSMKFNMTGDLYAIRWDRNGKPEWVKVIRKKQEEPDLDLFLSIACIKDSKDIVHIFFHDDTENTEVDPDSKIKQAYVGGKVVSGCSLAAISIAKDGRIKKQFVLSNEGREYQFSPKRTFAVGGNELFFVSVKHNMFGKMNYNLGKVSIK